MKGCSVLALASMAMLGLSAAVVTPKATDEALVNPGMGFVHYHYSNRLWAYGSQQEPGDTLDWFPGASVIYFRLNWSTLEPEEGVFRWDVIDSYAQPWIAKGNQITYSPYKYSHYQTKGRYRVGPAYLVPAAKTDVPADTSLRYVLSVKVPSDAAPGKYAGVVRIGAVVAADSAVLRQADGKGTVRVPEDLPYGDYSLEAALLDGETAYQDRTEAFRRTGI